MSYPLSLSSLSSLNYYNSLGLWFLYMRFREYIKNRGPWGIVGNWGTESIGGNCGELQEVLV